MVYDILKDDSDVMGEIYLITNTITNKQYVGQTLTHRKNNAKYRPFGFEGRFKDHVSEALCNTKKKQCRYLNNSIRHNGRDAFTVKLLETCTRDKLDQKEKEYIKEYSTFYPNGYNLTRGGKTLEHASNELVEISLHIDSPSQTNPNWRYEKHSSETKKKISEQLKKVFGTEEQRKKQMYLTKAQHEQQKFDRFKNEVVDPTNLEQYLYVKHIRGKPYVIVKINDKQTSFVGLYETFEELNDRAKEFLIHLSVINCDAAKLTGNP